MAVKTGYLTGSSDTFSKYIYKQDGDLSEYEMNYTPSFRIDVGLMYTYYNNCTGPYDSFWYRERTAETCACRISFKRGEAYQPEPKAASRYTWRLEVALDSGWGYKTYVGILNSVLSSDGETGYNTLMARSTMTEISSIPANSTTGGTYTLSDAELDKLDQYGLALVPAVEAEIADISDYIDITEYSRTRYFYNGTDHNLRLYYTVENLASPGVVSDILPSALSTLVSNKENTITWTYTQEFEAAQYYVGITATYLDTGETVLICRKQIISAESGTTSSFTIPADTLRTGKVRFTISAMPLESANYYDDDDAIWVTGSTVEYTVRSTPEAGAVTCDGKPNPTVSWESSTQAAFQVRFDDYDSGVIAGNDTSYTVPKIFANGNYAVSIRTATAAGEWSDWTEDVYVSIANTPLSGTVTLAATQFEFNVQLSWVSTVTPDRYAIYRDGELIAVVAETPYIDRFSNGTAEYFVRAVVDGNYTESNHIDYTLSLNCDLISVDGGYTYKPMKYTPSPKSQVDLFNDDITYQYYSGREKPIAISSGRLERVKEFTYVFKKRSESLFLRKMSEKAVLVKTTRGCVIYGVINELQYIEARRTTVSFTVREIFREGEEVDYVF